MLSFTFFFINITEISYFSQNSITNIKIFSFILLSAEVKNMKADAWFAFTLLSLYFSIDFLIYL